MFLPVNVQEFVNSILTFIDNNTFESSHSKFFPIIGVYIRYTSGIPSGGIISSKAACFRSAVLVDVNSLIGFYGFWLFYYILWERLFLGNCSNWLLQLFKATFNFNLTRKESFLETTLQRDFLHISGIA